MTKDSPATIDDLRRAADNARIEQSKEFQEALAHIDACQTLNLASFHVAVNAHEAGIDIDFNYAYAAIVSRTIATTEAILELLLRALYGPAAGLVRSLFTDWDTVRYLDLDGRCAAEWRELASHYLPGFASRDKSARWRELEARFSDGAIRKRLEEEGEASVAEAYGMGSEALHSTAWGVLFFSKPSYAEPGSYTLQDVPRPDVLMSTYILAMLFAMALKLPELLVKRADRYRISIQGMDVLYDRMRRVGPEMVKYTNDVIMPMADLMGDVWNGRARLPNSDAEAREFLEARLRRLENSER